MADDPEKKEEQPKDAASALANYLKAPKKRKRSFVVLALNAGFDEDIGLNIETYVSEKFNYGVLCPKNEKELKRAFARQLALIIIDDEFLDLKEILLLIKSLKEKKNAEVVPVMFLTREPEKLIKFYHEILLPYQESDEFVVYPGSPIKQILSRVKNGLERKSRRRSRRYNVDLPVQFSFLGEDKQYPGKFVDLSVHGALLKADGENQKIFRVGRQLRITLDVSKYLIPTEGEFLKISAVVQRVFISGVEAGIRFEFLTERKNILLSQLLTDFVSKQMLRKSQALRLGKKI